LAAVTYRWEIMPPAPAEHLTSFPDLSPLVVQLLYNRRVSSPDAVEAFLDTRLIRSNPFLLKGMDKATTRLRQAIRADEAIAVYGDYDADGVTATALLVSTLTTLGAQVVPYIPSRKDEGYGLNNDALEKLARQGVKVVVTVDCGIRAVEQVAFAHSLGLDMIITDHHIPSPDDLPPAIAVIDPKREDDPYPYKHLAGVGLAFRLAQALLRAESKVRISKSDEFAQEEGLLDLVALGTVADLAPLGGENRIIVRHGLEKLNQDWQALRPGIAAMLREARLHPGQVDADTIGFVLGPRLNAAGRMGDAMDAYDLLMASSSEEAADLAQQLGNQNRQRTNLTAAMVEHARNQVAEFSDDLIYVLASPTYRAGIAGLVASRIKDEFYRPTLVIGMEKGQSKGSARSIKAFHITEALEQCRDLLVRYGGHAAAAGCTVRNDSIDALRSRLRDIARGQLKPSDLIPSVQVDMVLPFARVNWETLSLTKQLEPCGMGNPHPTFASYDVQVRHCRTVGRETGGTRHLQLALSDGKAVWDAIAFRTRWLPEEVPPRIDVVYTLAASTWNGRKRLQLRVKDLRPSQVQEQPS